MGDLNLNPLYVYVYINDKYLLHVKARKEALINRKPNLNEKIYNIHTCKMHIFTREAQQNCRFTA